MNDSPHPPTKPRIQGWRFWLGATLSLVSVLWLALTTDWAEAWTALRQANYGLLLAAIGLALVTIPMRTARWRLLFPAANSPDFGRLTAVMLIGQTLNVIFPARVGDLTRATLVGTERTAYVLGTIMIQTALDLLMLAGLVVLLLFRASLPNWWRESGQALALTAAVALLIMLVLILTRHRIIQLLMAVSRRAPQFGRERLVTTAVEFLRSLDSINPSTAVAALTWSAGIWAVYAAVNYTLLSALHAPTSWLAALFLLVVLQLGVAVPSSPGRVGVFHYLSVQALAIFDVGGATAVSCAIILHIISIILPAVLGAILTWKMGFSLTVKAKL